MTMSAAASNLIWVIISSGAMAETAKHLFLSLDAGLIPQNPFYKAYRSKSFTDNDITRIFCCWISSLPAVSSQ